MGFYGTDLIFQKLSGSTYAAGCDCSTFFGACMDVWCGKVAGLGG